MEAHGVVGVGGGGGCDGSELLVLGLWLGGDSGFGGPVVIRVVSVGANVFT